MLKDRYYTDSGIDEIPIMCDRGCVTNGDDTVRDLNTVPTNRLLKGKFFSPVDQISTNNQTVPLTHDVFRMWSRPKSRSHAGISFILHINVTIKHAEIYKKNCIV